MRSEPSNRASDSNPFSTRHTRPGAIPFVFSEPAGGSQLVESLRQHNWWGAIVGPHGSGKSTLLESLEPLLVSAGRVPRKYVLHSGERSLPAQAAHDEWLPNTLVIVDGYEQLSWWSRRRLAARCRRVGCGLLVTSHQRVKGFPTLYQTSSNPQFAISLARQLLSGYQFEISDAEISQCFANSEGNLRETWFKLFDIYEQRQRAAR